MTTAGLRSPPRPALMRPPPLSSTTTFDIWGIEMERIGRDGDKCWIQVVLGFLRGV